MNGRVAALFIRARGIGGGTHTATAAIDAYDLGVNAKLMRIVVTVRIAGLMATEEARIVAANGTTTRTRTAAAEGALGAVPGSAVVPDDTARVGGERITIEEIEGIGTPQRMVRRGQQGVTISLYPHQKGEGTVKGSADPGTYFENREGYRRIVHPGEEFSPKERFS